MPKRPGGKMVAGEDVSKSQLAPFIGKGLDFRSKAFLIPAAVTMATVALLFHFPPKYFADVVVFFLGFGAHYVIYRLCGKDRPWQMEALCAGVTVAVIIGLFGFIRPLYDFIIPIIPPDPNTQAWADEPWLLLFFETVINIGVLEELIKISPLFLIIWALRKKSKKDQAKFGITEPLDGILYASASAGAFAITETVLVYLPEVFAKATIGHLMATGVLPRVEGPQLDSAIQTLTPAQIAAATPAGDLAMIMLAVPRALGEIFGHVAYSGYFGYFVGLSVLKPKHKWKLLGIGLASSSVLHGLWDAIDPGVTVMFVVGTASYFALIAAILKARQLSPTRAMNFATYAVSEPTTAPPSVPVPVAAASPAFTLVVGRRRIPLMRGTTLVSQQLPGLTARAADGIVGAVSHNPKHPKILGIKNCSVATWSGHASSGTSLSVLPGQSVRLEPGLTLQLGSSSAIVE
jgi:RsiW-degrading membrane proteinase PrsW (M82 family)